MALEFGISDLIIGLTVVALGTSLPELAVSVSSALKKQHQMVKIRIRYLGLMSLEK